MNRHKLQIAMGIFSILVIGSILWIVVAQAIATQRKPFKSQSELVSFADSNQLPNKMPIEKYTSPLCSSGDSGYNSGCTLSRSFIYKLEGDYRTEGKKIFRHLKTRGFDFRPTSKYIKKTADKLNDESIAANMKNTEPIIVDLYHNKRDARVRVHLGDHRRTLSGARGSNINSVGPDQLIAGIYFYSP